MLNISAAREGFKEKGISDICFVRSSHNIADGFTKSMSQAAIQHVIKNGLLHIEPERWVIRH